MQEASYRKVSDTEYEVIIQGRTKLIKTPFEKVSQIFRTFIDLGGVIDVETGDVKTDILSLITSFKSVGNILLTEHDDYGKVIVEGNCSILSTTEVISLFTLAVELISNFTEELAPAMKGKRKTTPSENETK